MKFKRIFSVMLVVVLLLSMCPVGTIAAEPVSTGDGWVFTDDGTLTISSNRAMEGNMPGTGDWHDYPTVVTDLVIENGVTHLYDFNEFKITSLVIPEGVIYIGEGAFSYNTQLETIVLPKSVKQISSDAFGGCNNIKTVYYAGSESDRNNISFFTPNIPSGNNDTFNNADWKYSTASGNGWIFTADGTLTISSNRPMEGCLPGAAPWYNDYSRLVTNLVIENEVTHLYGLNQLKITTLVIPEGVTYIGEGAFSYNTQLETIILPKSVEQISSDAFGDCSNIKTVYYAGSECDRNSISFFTNGGPSFGNNDTFNNAEWEYAAASGHDYDADDDGNNEGIVTTAPSCTEQGYTTYTCNVCGDVAKDYVDALGHTNADAVKENEVAADCTTDGSYDSVIYCSVCDTELSRTTVDIKAFNHNWVNGSCIRCLHNAIKSVLDGNTLTLTLPGFSKSSYIVVSWYDTGDRMLGSYMTGITDETLILNLPIWTTPDKINFSCFDSDSHVLTELNSVNIPALIWIKTTDQEIN